MLSKAILNTWDDTEKPYVQPPQDVYVVIAGNATEGVPQEWIDSIWSTVSAANNRRDMATLDEQESNSKKTFISHYDVVSFEVETWTLNTLKQGN